MGLLADLFLEESWRQKLETEFSASYFCKLETFVEEENKAQQIFPPKELIFNAFHLTPLEQVKVVILGQDPYHGENQANGLSFSVNKSCKIPPSLKNIFKELHSDLDLEIPKNGNLEAWAKQGILLLNSCLTVRAKEAASHQKKGWEVFTDKVIEIISKNKENVVFLLWGNFAHSKEKLIDSQKHLVLKAAHPSPLARGAFFGSKPFSKTNNSLKLNNLGPINWKL